MPKAREKTQPFKWVTVEAFVQLKHLPGEYSGHQSQQSTLFIFTNITNLSNKVVKCKIYKVYRSMTSFHNLLVV